jgi:peptidoglycan glycosyltransferase
LGAIAGDGTGALPYVISEIKADGEVMYAAKPQPGRELMSRDLAKLLQEYMRNNVALKYGDDHFPGLNVCAKTGTAEQDGKTPTAMLAGFVADEQYPLAFIICVEEGGYGANTCLPIASKVLAACKLILDNG